MRTKDVEAKPDVLPKKTLRMQDHVPDSFQAVSFEMPKEPEKVSRSFGVLENVEVLFLQCFA